MEAPELAVGDTRVEFVIYCVLNQLCIEDNMSEELTVLIDIL